MPWGVAAAAVGAYGAIKSSKTNKEAAEAGTTTKEALDPRIENVMLGGYGSDGLFQQWSRLGQGQQPQALQEWGNYNQNYLAANGQADMNTIRNTGNSLMQGNAAPMAQAASAAGPGPAPQAAGGGAAQAANGAQINAPSQNSISTQAGFDKMINGDAGANPYLTNAMNAAVTATNAGFSRNQNALLESLQGQVLPGIRSGAIGAGQYGGSRQAIVESNAIKDYTKQLTDANVQTAATNSANFIGQQANAFNQGQDRSLGALTNLSGQQYQTANNQAGLTQANNQFNSNLNLQNNALGQANNQFNAGLQQQGNQMQLANNQFNAGLQQQVGLANQSSQLQTNQQNMAGALSGAGLLSGQIGTAYNNATAANNWKINQAQQVSGLLYPMLGAGASTNTTQPYYSNTTANALGGAAAGLSLYNQFNQAGSGSSGSSSGYNAQDIRNVWG